MPPKGRGKRRTPKKSDNEAEKIESEKTKTTPRDDEEKFQDADTTESHEDAKLEEKLNEEEATHNMQDEDDNDNEEEMDSHVEGDDHHDALLDEDEEDEEHLREDDPMEHEEHDLEHAEHDEEDYDDDDDESVDDEMAMIMDMGDWDVVDEAIESDEGERSDHEHHERRRSGHSKRSHGGHLKLDENLVIFDFQSLEKSATEKEDKEKSSEPNLVNKSNDKGSADEKVTGKKEETDRAKTEKASSVTLASVVVKDKKEVQKGKEVANKTESTEITEKEEKDSSNEKSEKVETMEDEKRDQESPKKEILTIKTLSSETEKEKSKHTTEADTSSKKEEKGDKDSKKGDTEDKDADKSHEEDEDKEEYEVMSYDIALGEVERLNLISGFMVTFLAIAKKFVIGFDDNFTGTVKASFENTTVQVTRSAVARSLTLMTTAGITIDECPDTVREMITDWQKRLNIKGCNPIEKSIFIDNLPETANELKLREQFPSSIRACIPRKQDGSAESWGVLELGTKTEALKIADDPKLKFVDGRRIRVKKVKRGLKVIRSVPALESWLFGRKNTRDYRDRLMLRRRSDMDSSRVDSRPVMSASGRFVGHNTRSRRPMLTSRMPREGYQKMYQTGVMQRRTPRGAFSSRGSYTSTWGMGRGGFRGSGFGSSGAKFRNMGPPRSNYEERSRNDSFSSHSGGHRGRSPGSSRDSASHHGRHHGDESFHEKDHRRRSSHEQGGFGGSGSGEGGFRSRSKHRSPGWDGRSAEGDTGRRRDQKSLSEKLGVVLANEQSGVEDDRAMVALLETALSAIKKDGSELSHTPSRKRSRSPSSSRPYMESPKRRNTGYDYKGHHDSYHKEGNRYSSSRGSFSGSGGRGRGSDSFRSDNYGRFSGGSSSGYGFKGKFSSSFHGDRGSGGGYRGNSGGYRGGRGSSDRGNYRGSSRGSGYRGGRGSYSGSRGR